MTPLVVKLGGSTAGHDEMQRWIDCLATASFPLVIVPGGGPFADGVRALQKSLHFSDDAAHDMAILAMDQFGHVIAERHPRLVPARTLHDIHAVLQTGRIPVWLPSVMTCAAPDIPRSWDVTSDSLAAWLCGQVGSRDLLLVKQAGAADDPQTLDALVTMGVVDSMLPRFLGETTLHIAARKALWQMEDDLPLSGIPGWRVADMLRERSEG